MIKTENQKEISISFRRTFWRTASLLALFVISSVIYRNNILVYPSLSIANAMTHIENEHIASKELILDLLFFLITTVALHLIWAYIIATSCKPLLKKTTNNNIKTQTWLLISILHFSLAVSANSYFYPTSLLGFLRDTVLSTPIYLITLSSTLLLLFIWGLYITTKKKVFFAIVSISIIPIASTNIDNFKAYNSTTKAPNIIIIGIDGLRPDHLSYQDQIDSLSPHIDSFLSQSLIYEKTYTPMGRTYVSWMSLLKGQYPKTHGARFNLTPPELINQKIQLVETLKKQNYLTTYAIDERRFNQIDEGYGFNQAIGPKIGAADAIISNFSDLPLVNLFANTPISKYIFPYIYINRAYGKTYNPILFNQEVISSLSPDQPNFLSVHFCMLHWPYTSTDFIDIDLSLWNGNYNHFMYQAMIKKMDNQFMNFINNLKENNYLDDAIVFLISDHGEGFMLNNEYLTNSRSSVRIDNYLNLKAWGHGTNILNQKQANILLAYRRFKNGKSTTQPGIIEGLFSLVDIAPTIFKELNLKSTTGHDTFDGLALPTTFKETTVDRHIFVESASSVKSINTSFIDDKKVIYETASKYEVRENGRLVLKPDIYPDLLKKKQRSIYYKDWQLIMLTDYDDLVLVNTDNKQWSNLSEYQGIAPWSQMLSSLCQHYQGDIGFDPLERCSINSSQSAQN